MSLKSANTPAGADNPYQPPVEETPQQKAEAVEKRATQTGDPQFFAGTIIKINADGVEVMSDHLMPGEKLRRETSDAHKSSTIPQSQQREPVHAEDRKKDADKKDVDKK